MIVLNGMILSINKFPNNEVEIPIHMYTKIQPVNTIIMKFESNEDIVNLMFIKKHLDEQGTESELIIPYLPYSRMDRTEGKKLFTLKYFAQLINSLNFKRVVTYEAHSNVSLALIDRLENVDKTINLLDDYINHNGNKKLAIFLPDEGAYKRYVNKMPSYLPILVGQKSRDFITGKIKSLDVIGELPKGHDVVIIDDLCSRGGTFVLSATALKTMGANNIDLIVTHCEKTILDGDIPKSDLINKVITTDSIISRDDIDKEHLDDKIVLAESIFN